MVVATVTDSSSAGEATGTPLTIRSQYRHAGNAPRDKNGRNSEAQYMNGNYNIGTEVIGRVVTKRGQYRPLVWGASMHIPKPRGAIWKEQ